MSEINNYIPISRKLFEHRFWCEGRVYSRFEAWLDIIQSARFEDTEHFIGNRRIEVKRGQLPVSLRYLAERWQWSTKKVNNYLELLIHAQMITKETPKETGQNLLTICNYDKYNFDPEIGKQQKKRKGNSMETAGKQHGNKNNKENNLKKENNIIPPLPPLEGEAVVAKSWRDDFEVYISEAKAEYKKIINNDAFIEDRERFFPSVDIRLSIEKAFNDFWCTTSGWEHKKKSKTITIDWKSTMKKSLDQKFNQILKQNGRNANNMFGVNPGSAKSREIETCRNLFDYASDAFGKNIAGD